MTGLQTIGVIILGNGLVVGVVLLVNKTIDWKAFLALEAVFVLAALVASNFDSVSAFGFKTGGNAFNLQMQRVEARAQRS